MDEVMDKTVHLEYLRKKYIELSQQFLKELQDGKSIHMLRDINTVIETLHREIEAIESELDQAKENKPSAE